MKMQQEQGLESFRAGGHMDTWEERHAQRGYGSSAPRSSYLALCTWLLLSYILL